MNSLFRSLCRVGIHELQRSGMRSSFRPKPILHMVEKFAASDIDDECSSELYELASICLEKKGYNDASLVAQLKDGTFGFSSQRPLVWLWRFSSRQRKEVPPPTESPNLNIAWSEIFNDTTKPLVVDLGSGMGVSILNLALLNTTSDAGLGIFDGNGRLNLHWSECNYAGTELNQALVNFGNGIIYRDTTLQRLGRVHFFCIPAQEFLHQLEQYPGGIALVMINFPSPYQMEASVGNSQLPLIGSGQFMVTKNLLESIGRLLSKSDLNGYLLFQTKCEDVAVHVRNECLGLGTLESVACMRPVQDIDKRYLDSGNRPKRVDYWLGLNPNATIATGIAFSSTPLLPAAGQPETDAQCQIDNKVVHRCLFKLNSKSI